MHYTTTMETIFSKIIKGEIPADIVYEDEHTLAFLDIRPRKKGHTLVIPKKPCKDIFELDDETGSHLMRTVAKVSRAVRDGVNAGGVNLIVNNGAIAGQEVFHIHVHVIPRHNVEEFPALPEEHYENDEEKQSYLEKIKSAI